MSHKRSWSRVQDYESFGKTFDAVFRKKGAQTARFDGREENVANPPKQSCPNHESLEDVLTDPESGFSKP